MLILTVTLDFFFLLELSVKFFNVIFILNLVLLTSLFIRIKLSLHFLVYSFLK